MYAGWGKAHTANIARLLEVGVILMEVLFSDIPLASYGSAF